ncbi:MAG: glycogen/starch/alpha-glucan phosphorylase [Oscillospiraceae bacterium]|nr:glycogen/starch/alpha-glucan phosphorylase [Oscillospiraceae bacterium]
MQKPTLEKAELRSRIEGKLRRTFGCDVSEAGREQVFKAAALVVRDLMTANRIEKRAGGDAGKRQVHYLSMEFLMGRSLMKNAYNLGVLEPLSAAIEDMGFSAADLFEAEPDAGLGNGGLGRLAACYLDAMTTLEIPATGYSICYELGIFKQKIVDGQQVELADHWLHLGDAWLITRMDETEEVRFGGTVQERWEDGRAHMELVGYTPVLAVPRDMEISGYETDCTNTLRLWDAKSAVPADMSLYSRGEYLKAVEQQAMAEVIAKVLYPDDNHYEGKSLRLRQQYFFVSATVQSIARKHRARYGTLRNFHQKHVIQINDTHPALVIPELMRILLDEEGMGWDEAWHIVTHTVAYTNHTVLTEALERWPQDLVEHLLPRIWLILREISDRYERELTERFCGDKSKVEPMAIIWDGGVRMANLCVTACFAVNGVSELHSDILKNDLFREAARLRPAQFHNVTNGVDHRRWLAQVNPGLHSLICGLIGDGYLLRPDDLKGLERYAGDSAVLETLAAVKRENKAAFAAWCRRSCGVELNTEAMFDVQVKRLHEYKRQLLNAIHITYLYERLHADPHFDFTPRTFLFGAKAAPGYAVAKEIIRLLNSLSAAVNADPLCKDRLQVVFLENYRVSMAEALMPAAELSEQISTAGKEASGTGNMKFMMNGALTIGTLDGANVEMHNRLGDGNMFLFGLTADEVAACCRQDYRPYDRYIQNEWLHMALDRLTVGFGDGVSYKSLTDRLLFGAGGSAADEYMLLADFESYRAAQERAGEAYRNAECWNAMALRNIARSGVFAADRAVGDYAGDIWRVPTRRL